VRGATVISGYIDNPQANSASFVDGWFRSGDLGSLDARGYLDLKGRIKELINRGGEKIAPSDIDVVLLSNPAVLEAVTFAEPHPIYGECVHAAVVLRIGSETSESELEDYCRSKLSGFEVPERIHIVSEIPHTAKGSVDRMATIRRSKHLGISTCPGTRRRCASTRIAPGIPREESPPSKLTRSTRAIFSFAISLYCSSGALILRNLSLPIMPIRVTARQPAYRNNGTPRPIARSVPKRDT